MLLLPLFLWWAHSPLCVATGRIRSFLCVTIVLSVLFAALAPHSQAEDRFPQRTASDAGLFSDPLNVSREDDSETKKILLREGTLIPPTSGRIVMLGRRWTFLPAWADKEQDDSTASSRIRHIDMFESAIASLARARKVVGYSRNNTPVSLPATSKPTPTRLASTKVDDTPETKEPNHEARLGQVLLSENLMLQRIVESIRVDGSDDRWTLTGEVSEFMGENRLLIRTAQRAASRQ